MPITKAQQDAMLKGFQANPMFATPAPTVAPKRIAGPTLDGSALMGTPTPTPAATPKPTPAPITPPRTQAPDGAKLPGPYPNYDASGNMASVSQGATVTNGRAVPNPVPAPPAATPAPTPAPQQNSGLDRSALQAEVATRIAKLRAGVEGAVTAGKASRTNVKNYNDKTTQGNRVLRNATNYAKSDPFQGSTMENNFRIQREDGINDTFTNNAYTNDINALDNQLTSFDSLAEEQQQTLFNDLLRQEREYNLQEGSLTGTLNGQQTLAAKSQEQNYGLGVAGLTGQYNGQRTIAGQQLDLNQKNDQRNFDYGVGRDTVLDNRYDKQIERSNFESDRSYDIALASQKWNQAFQTEQYTDQKAQQLWENTFKDKSFTQSMNEAAASRGLQWATLDQRGKEFVADQAFKEKSFTAEQEQNKINNDYRAGEAELSKGLDIYKSTGQAPAYLSKYGIDVSGLSDPAIKDDLNALYTALSTDALKPKDALKTIQDKIRIGAEDPVSGKKLTDAIYSLYPELDPSKASAAGSKTNVFKDLFNKWWTASGGK